MFGIEKTTSKSAFKAGVLSTFGKLDEQDIMDVDGRSERLATQLMDRYDWSSAYAQTRVDEFCSNLLTPLKVVTAGQINGGWVKEKQGNGCA